VAPAADIATFPDVFVGLDAPPEFEPVSLSHAPRVTLAIESEPEDTLSEETVTHVDDTPLPNLTAFRERLQAIRDRAIGAGLLPGVSSVSVPPTPAEPQSAPPEAPVEEQTELGDPNDWAFELPLGTVEERLEAFASWAYRHISGGEILVVDDHGDLLWGQHARPELILSTLMARNASSRSSPLSACGLSGTIHYSLASGNTLTVIPCDTRLGMIQVVICAAEGLPEMDADRLRQALIAAMDTQD
jgi:hypothetical protein